MKDSKEPSEEIEAMPNMPKTTSPLDVEGVDLDLSTGEMLQFLAEGRRGAPPMIQKASTGQPISALSADELAAIEADEDLERHVQSTQPQEQQP
jgi:hypothetical protein